MRQGIPNKKYTSEFEKLVAKTIQKEKLGYRETAERFEVRHKRAQKTQIVQKLGKRHAPNYKTVRRLMKGFGLVCRVRMKKDCSDKSRVGEIAPVSSGQELLCRKTQPKMGYQCDRVQFIGRKTLFLADS